MSPLQIHHLILALVLILVMLRLFFKFKRLHKLGDSYEVSPKTLLLIACLMLVGSGIFIFEHHHAMTLAIAWCLPFLVSLIITLSIIRHDPITYNNNNKKLKIPTRRRKFIFSLVVIYICLYMGLQFIDPALILNPHFLIGYVLFKGVIAGTYVGMNGMYIYKYLSIKTPPA